MTLGIPEWNLILNAVVAVLVTGYGIWFKYIVKAQIDAKDATIQMLNTQNDKLAKETAPAMAAQLKQLGEYAESITKTLQDEKKKYDDLVAASIPKDAAGLVLPVTDELIERERLSVVNSILTDQLEDMRGTIRALQHETDLLKRPSYLGRIELTSPVGKLSDMLGDAGTKELVDRFMNRSSPTPLMGEPKTEEAENKKKPKGFKI